jgi:hypothetical protein
VVFTVLELTIVSRLLCSFFFTPLQQAKPPSFFTTSAIPTTSATEGLTAIHTEISALPTNPEIQQQMLLYIQIAEIEISKGDLGNAREAMLDFCRRIEWHRYQIGHTKINNMFNQAMSIAIELHNASVE